MDVSRKSKPAIEHTGNIGPECVGAECATHHSAQEILRNIEHFNIILLCSFLRLFKRKNIQTYIYIYIYII